MRCSIDYGTFDTVCVIKKSGCGEILFSAVTFFVFLKLNRSSF